MIKSRPIFSFKNRKKKFTFLHFQNISYILKII